jgi:hypothetical protein
MFRFTYTRGEWSDGIALPESIEDEDFSVYLGRIGYASSKLCIGSEHESVIEIYESTDRSSFYASVSPLGESCYDVFLPDFPSLMHFLKEFGSVFSALVIAGDQRETISLMERLFRIYHGHGIHELCQECDPKGWAAAVRMKEKRGQLGARST